MSKLIPFRWMPGSWGLKGQAFDIAEAHYLYTGEELERRLATITCENDHHLRACTLKIDLKYGKIDKYAYELGLLELKTGTTLVERKALELSFGKITAYDHDIAVADFLAENAVDRARRVLIIEHTHKRISDYDRDVGLAKLDCNESEIALALLKIDCQYGKITPYDHDIAVANLLAVDAEDRKRLLLAVELEHKRIDQYDFDVTLAKLMIKEEAELELSLIDIDAQHGKISEIAAQKAMATIKGEPWVGVIEDSFDPEKGADGFAMKLDWNDLWIIALREAGYDGYEEDDVVRAWFQDVCQEYSTLDDMKVIPFPNHREGS